MVSRINTVAFQGVDVLDIDVQVQIAGGLPTFTIVGLPDKAIAESKERIRAALNAIGLALPPKRITVNLAPADVLKVGSHFDLAIATGLLASMEVLPKEDIINYTVLGELALDGKIASVAGVLPAAIAANAAGRGLICPAKQGGEAVWAGGKDIQAPNSLLELINHFKGTQILCSPKATVAENDTIHLDLKDIKGQEAAKRVLEIAASGGHHMLMIGPPGAGKSMLAARMTGILPSLAPDEALEVSMIHSIAGQLKNGGLIQQRPFRDPHHTATTAALVGGGHKVKPGEISLAHMGGLFLDELPEFSRATLESLRQPLETGRISVARANSHVTYPARVQLIAAMNPCKCGHLGNPQLECNKAPKCAVDYQSKISGPLFDRIDLHVDVPAVKPWDMSTPAPSESSEEIIKRVTATRLIQRERYAVLSKDRKIRCNAEADGKILDAVATPDEKGRQLLIKAAEQLSLSARGWHRVLKVSRTIADMERSENIKHVHIAEALSYRRIIPGRAPAKA